MALPKFFQKIFSRNPDISSSKWQACTWAIMWALARPWLVVGDAGTKITDSNPDLPGVVSETTWLAVFVALITMAVVQGFADVGKEAKKLELAAKKATT